MANGWAASRPTKEAPMPVWLYLLLLAVPGAVLSKLLDTSPLLTFILAALGVIPLAGLIGEATESLAERVGPLVGGLLNATFGNAAELIIGISALAAGLPDVVRAAIAGRRGAKRCSSSGRSSRRSR